MSEPKAVQNKMRSLHGYSVSSILEIADDDLALDLSLKEARTKTDKLSNDQHNENIHQMFLNLMQQKNVNHLGGVNNALEAMHQTRCSFDNISKLRNIPTKMPWNSLRPDVTTIPASGNNILSQFQKIIFNKKLSHQSYFRNIFSPSTVTNQTVNPNNFYPNQHQFFNTRLNLKPNLTDSRYLNYGADNFVQNHFPSASVDLNSHFNLQKILKSTSNRKRKRTKVTDTRLPRRTALHQTINPYSQIHDTVEHNLTRFPSFIQSSSNSSQSSHTEEVQGDPKKYTLTPIHLRKAKLMFLYTRYPNSQMLKSYFPDITFCKQNTAQLVKWFSNFREFYYSEMEKAVQRALSNGTQYAKDIDVTVDSELFKNLMTHFNKKKQIVVPCEFLTTVQITLREFFDAISTGKNLHQSWKKPIYKNIAKLDQPLSDFFKDMNWMMELAKDENDNISS